jgi:dynein light intermediate chain
MNVEEEEGVKNYLNSPSLLQYSEKKDLEPKEDDFFARIKFRKKEENKKNDKEQKPKNSQLVETLNSMFPPKQWEEEGHRYIQYVSSEPATREKSRDLFKALDQKLKERRAKEKGICPVRQELYSQCFDEIIRQVTIDNTERGLLLLKVRDEIKMSIASYQILYESAILYGIRKQLQSEDAREELKKTLEEKEKKTIELTNKKIALENKLQSLKKHFAERKEIEASKREKDLNFLNQQKESLDKIIRNISQPIK